MVEEESEGEHMQNGPNGFLPFFMIQLYPVWCHSDPWGLLFEHLSGTLHVYLYMSYWNICEIVCCVNHKLLLYCLAVDSKLNSVNITD